VEFCFLGLWDCVRRDLDLLAYPQAPASPRGDRRNPDLFTEGKGAVVEGRIGRDGVFQATTIMAHAEEYSPHVDNKDGYPNLSVMASLMMVMLSPQVNKKKEVIL
jgi:CcmE